MILVIPENKENLDFSNKLPRFPTEYVFTTIDKDGNLVQEIKTWPEEDEIQPVNLAYSEKVQCPTQSYVTHDVMLYINGGKPGTWVSYTGDAVGSIQLNSNGYAAIKMNFLISGKYIIALYFEGTRNQQRRTINVYNPTASLPTTAVKNYPFTYSVIGAIPGTDLLINDCLIGKIDNAGNLQGTVTVAVPGNYSFTFSSNSWNSTQKIVVL